MAQAAFFPTSEIRLEQSIAESTCRRCDVQITCFEQSLDYPRDTTGIWGGLGSAKRRRLRQARSSQIKEGYPLHRFTPGCSCRFCRMADGFLRGEVIDMNTDGARCGYRSTYARGHRDTACTYPVALHTRRLNTITA